MSIYYLLDVDLALFDGEGGTGAAAAGGSAEGGSTEGETKGGPVYTRRGKKAGEFDNVVFGKQAAPKEEEPAADQTAGSDAGSEEQEAKGEKPGTPEDKRKAYLDLIGGEYKDIHTQEVQNIIDRRFKQAKETEAKLNSYQPVLDMLAKRYNVEGGDAKALAAAIESDDNYWSNAADEAGMTVDQFKRMQKLELENVRLRQRQQQAEQDLQYHNIANQWAAQEQALQAKYPDFHLVNEFRDPQFAAAVKAGLPLEAAYQAAHFDDLVSSAVANAASRQEKAVVDNIRAKGNRPAENGTVSQSAFTVKDDVSKLTRKERAEIARRVMRGEKISF